VGTTLTGLLVAVALVMFTRVNPYADALVYWAIIGALGAGLALASACDRGGRVTQGMLAVPALFVSLTLLVVVRNVELSFVIVVPFVAVFVSGLLRLVFARTRQGVLAGLTLEHLLAAGISASLLAACVFGLWLSEQGQQAYITGGFLLTVVGAVLGGVFLPSFKTDFEQLMRIEGDRRSRQPSHRPGPEQGRAAGKAWPRLVGYALSGFTSMLVLTIAVAPSLGWRAGHAKLEWAPAGVAVLIIGFLLVPAGNAVMEAFRKHPYDLPMRSPAGTSGSAWWCCVAAIVASALLIPALFRDGSVQPLAVVQALLITSFAVLSVLSNAAWLNLGNVRWSSRAAIGAVAMAVLATVYWSLTVAVRPEGSPASPGQTILGWSIAVLAVVLLVEIASAAVYVSAGRPYMTDYPPGFNVSQDLFHLAILWFVLGWLPQFVLANVPASSPERWAAIGTILAGFLLLFGPAFLWVLENNDTHVERQRRVREVPRIGTLTKLADATSSAARIRTLIPRIVDFVRTLRRRHSQPDGSRDQEFLLRLSGHTAIQNTLALTLATVSAVGVVGISAGFSPEATGLDSVSDIE
jgi:hypothetical protein